MNPYKQRTFSHWKQKGNGAKGKIKEIQGMRTQSGVLALKMDKRGREPSNVGGF